MGKSVCIGQNIAVEQCTGCAACVNACPRDAIVMAQSKSGFVFPVVAPSSCVNCGICLDICPALHPESNNNPLPDIYAYRANDTIRLQSSSGGVFSSLANKFIAEKGYVCGAAFDSEHILRHALANSLRDVKPMRGSKYLQSDIGLIYRKIKDVLEIDAKVIFTGTPCQVAAINAFLGKKYENFYCVDLVCHGVPPQNLFQKYLNELKQGREINNISFRDKRYGWKPDSTTLRIEFSDGQIYEGKSDADPWQRGFLTNMMLRKSCGGCPFCAYPRQGDLTMGDFWWYDQQPGGDNEDCGTSFVAINNAKGNVLLKILDNSAGWLKKIDTNPDEVPNRLHATIPVHESRRRFLDLCATKTFSEAARYCNDNYFDVGIVGPHENNNVGGFLTYYALYKAITDMGYTALMIGTPRSAFWGDYDDRNDLLEAPVYPDYAKAIPCQSNDDMRSLNGKCSQFVTGSDQIFKPVLYNNWGQYCRQDFVSDNKKKIAYAASFGSCNLGFSEKSRAELAYYLQKFDYFGVREADAVPLCETEFGVKATHVVDPVFLCAKEHYDSLANAAKIQNAPGEKFCHAYILSATDDKQKVIEEVCAIKQIPHRIYPNYVKKDGFYLKYINGNINARMRDWRDCSFTVTDSFHGLCFALIFRKDFILWPMFNWSFSRYESLLNQTGLQARMITGLQDFRAFCL